MSMNFKEDITEEHQSIIKEMFGDEMVAIDERTALFNSRLINQQKMKKIANKIQQPVEVELNDLEDIKTMTDGTRYQVTPTGWVKLD